MADNPTASFDSEGRRIIRTESEREWLYDQIAGLDPLPETLGDIKRTLNVNCAAIDIIFGIEKAYSKQVWDELAQEAEEIKAERHQNHQPDQ